MKYISVKNLYFSYDKDPVLEDVNFNIENGEFVTLTGENGAAKSTLIKVLLGILTKGSGEIFISDKNVDNKDLKISYLPQQAASFNSGFPTTVYDFVKSGLYRKKSWFKKFSSSDKATVDKQLKLLGVQELKNEKIGNLSGGQKQRVIIARLLVSNPDLLILDEPTTGMDEKTRNFFYTLLNDLVKKENKSLLLITHDNEVVEKFADKNIHLCKSETNSWCCKFHSKKEVHN